MEGVRSSLFFSRMVQVSFYSSISNLFNRDIPV